MANILKYGDTVKILNSFRNWDGGYLSVYGKSGISDGKHTVITTIAAGTFWRIESGTGKPVGSEVINNDTILLHNLYQCDGGYLGHYQSPNQQVPEGEIYPIHTSDKNIRPETLEWIIYSDMPSIDGKIKEDESITLYNRWGTRGFLDTSGWVGTPETVCHVYTSANNLRKPYTGLWKMTQVKDPCLPVTKPSNCAGECGTSDGGKYCFQVPQSIRFGLIAYTNTIIHQQTVKVYIDDLLVDTLTGKATETKAYTSGTGKVCIEIIGDGKPCKLRYSYNTLDGKPGSVIIGAENGSNNNYNDSVVVLNWPLVN
ncbi:fucose-binding lectin II [Photorhabdus luminescens]|uniref:Calcium-mediated lectin domain-containing protein n=1 Tax=Photorhabdus luminescens subsp. sonorensis TaxID=1173677 RepID=A0A5C4RM08_PHOLU|nr:fucose-binding lectin II [Photorhabdus luminescens]TNH44888.1 hypothetical protein EP164_03555 [Photorhabdus luminescens subsp. sonorensis]